MAKRPGQAGHWVLPAAAIFLGLVGVDAVLLITWAFVAHVLLTKLVIIVSALAWAAFAATLAGIAYLLLATLQHQQKQAGGGQLEQLVRRQSQTLETIHDATLVSDRAKAIAYREKERDALRRAIQEDVAKQDWEAAYHLVDVMQASFGYHQEADRLRGMIDQQRSQALHASMADELKRFRELLNGRDWRGARREAQELVVRYPDSAEAHELAGQVDEAWEAHKRHLLGEFKQVIDRSELDRGIELLKELDEYLTPGEAEGLREAARGVFRAKLHNLGVQFSMAVSEKNWDEALQAGKEIVDEFPNSRMAQEVRENLETLRERATAKSN